MLKIVVFDEGWGSEAVAELLEAELSAVEVIRVMHWPEQPRAEYDQETLRQIAEQNLEPYIGKVDLIVLGGYVTTFVLSYLRSKYPEQKFVGMSIDMRQIIRRRSATKRIMLLMGETLANMRVLEEFSRRLPEGYVIYAPDCASWEPHINNGEMSAETIRKELGYYFAFAPKRQVYRPRRYKTSAARSALDETLHKLRSKSTKTVVEDKPSSIARFIAMSANSPHPEPLESACEFGCVADTVPDRELYPAPDLVVLLDTHFWAIEPELESVFGFTAQIITFKQKFLHNVCLALKLRGLDGQV